MPWLHDERKDYAVLGQPDVLLTQYAEKLTSKLSRYLSGRIARSGSPIGSADTVTSGLAVRRECTGGENREQPFHPQSSSTSPTSTSCW